MRDASVFAAIALANAGVEVFEGSFDDPEAIRRAMAGVHGVYSVLPNGLPEHDEVRHGTSIADAAVAAGVEHLVYSSGASVGEIPTGVARFDAKPRIEAHVRGLGIGATIVRPMVFMETLVQPDYGLDKGKFVFFLRPDQSMQLVAVDDIGKLVGAIFGDRTRFADATVKLASDTVTGTDLAKAFSRAAGRPIAYARFPAEVLAAKPDLAHMSRSIDAGPLADHVDLALMRELDPDLLPFPVWLAGPGRAAFEKSLGRVSHIEDAEADLRATRTPAAGAPFRPEAAERPPTAKPFACNQ